MLLLAVQLAHTVSADLPQADHVVVVIFENHSFDEIVDPNHAPFIRGRAMGGALFVNAFAVSSGACGGYELLIN